MRNNKKEGARLLCPKPQAPGFRFWRRQLRRLPRRLVYKKALRTVSRSGGLHADRQRYPLASALGSPPGATPAKLCEHTLRVEIQPPK
jgi:hypothetical protein